MADVIIAKYYGYVPAIIIPDKGIEIRKTKFLLPEDTNFGLCCSNIRRHINIKANEAIFFLIENTIVDMNMNVGVFYKQYKKGMEPKQAFLYIKVIKENTFG